MHSLAQTFRPRSAAAASTTGLSLGPAPASMPPPPRPGGGGPPCRPPAGGGPCGACAAETIAPAAITTAIANPLVIVIPRNRPEHSRPLRFSRTDRECATPLAVCGRARRVRDANLTDGDERLRRGGRRWGQPA